MEFNRIIEGYSDNAVRKSSTYLSKLRSKMDQKRRLTSKLQTTTKERNKLQTKYENKYNDYIIDDPNLKLTKAEKERVLSILKKQIKELEKEIKWCGKENISIVHYLDFLIAEGRHKELTKEMKALRLIADTWVMTIKEYED